MPATIEDQVKPHFRFWREWRADRNNAQNAIGAGTPSAAGGHLESVNVEVVVHHPPAELQHASPGVCFRFIDGVQEAVPLLVHRLVEPVEPSLDIATTMPWQCTASTAANAAHFFVTLEVGVVIRVRHDASVCCDCACSNAI